MSGFLEVYMLVYGWFVVVGVAATASDAGEDVDEGAFEDDFMVSVVCWGVEWSVREWLGRIGLDLFIVMMLFE